MTGGYITDFFDFWKKLVDKNWTYSFWGVYHGLLGGISRTFLKKKHKQISLLAQKKIDLAKS